MGKIVSVDFGLNLSFISFIRMRLQYVAWTNDTIATCTLSFDPHTRSLLFSLMNFRREIMFTKHDQSRLIHLLLFISTARGTILDDSIEERRRNITSRLCPFTDLCHTKASRNFTYPVSYSSCCSDCNCEDDCAETNSCCPDKATDSGNPSKRVCKTTMVKKRFKEREFHDGFIDGIKNYFIIDYCPAAVEDLDIQERCHGLKKTTLDDYMWVSDTSTGEIFQNYNCAKCHGINDWRAWNIRTQCNYLEDTSFVNMSATLYSADCNIINEAPDDLASKTNKDRCFTPVITVCNQTGLWTEYDEFIDTECQRNTVPYFQNNFLVMDIYKNIFCYRVGSDQGRNGHLLFVI